MFRLYRARLLAAEVVMWQDKSVTLRRCAYPHVGDVYHVHSLATILVAELLVKSDVLVEVDSQGKEGQRWVGQQDVPTSELL